MSPTDGLAVIDKETGWTSHDVVAKARGVFGTRKVGHAGTLDPGATGVLLLGVGRATRLLRFITPLPKQYVGELILGAETTTLDAEGEVTAVYDMSAVTPEQVSEAASGFLGDIMQVPPMVSAIKIGGRRLHELAREGVEVEREPRPVTVHKLAVAPIDPDAGVYRIEVTCSSGTYIRSLAADIGAALGGGAHLRALRRMAIGSFAIDEARPVSKPSLLSMAEALRDYPAVSVDESLGQRVSSGQVMATDELAAKGDGPWAVLGPQGQLLAVYKPHTSGMVKPEVVIPQ
ncbi:MAG: tRNA pseudouridine(55) synthase TruB [Acidimicrobiia bacterium]|nr:tRNA pseudouridine(55) synthase TruB [Acidimicrobiia bacterium]MCY4435277.1 tRNA pseudouridine(55) synthase TruB [bacterium]